MRILGKLLCWLGRHGRPVPFTRFYVCTRPRCGAIVVEAWKRR